MPTAKQQFLAGLPGGFLNKPLLAKLVELDRLCLVLVRFSAGRFLAPAQDAACLCEIIERDNRHYIRDWSVNSKDMEEARQAASPARRRPPSR